MQQALELARKGRGLTSPNPAVGCVIEKDGQLLGSGFHTWKGVDHAEIVALRQVGDRARGANLYCTLEPCAHDGGASVRHGDYRGWHCTSYRGYARPKSASERQRSSDAAGRWCGG